MVSSRTADTAPVRPASQPRCAGRASLRTLTCWLTRNSKSRPCCGVWFGSLNYNDGQPVQPPC